MTLKALTSISYSCSLFVFIVSFPPGSDAVKTVEANQVKNVRQLTDKTMDVDNPSWSPDKKWLAVSNIRMIDGSEADELWIIDQVNGEKRKLLDMTQLNQFATYGYSIWDIRWINNGELTFVVSDNDVDSVEVKIAIQAPLSFKYNVRELDESSDIPVPLKQFLKENYADGSEQRENLSEYPSWYQCANYEGKWYVHYLRDPEFLIIDLDKLQATKSYLSTADIGDNLKFEFVDKRPLAVYPNYRDDSYYVDEIRPGEKAKQLFQIAGYPSFKVIDRERTYVSSRVRSSHPFYRAELFKYAFGDELQKYPTENWHNVSLSADGKKVAFIKNVDGHRILFVGDLE